MLTQEEVQKLYQESFEKSTSITRSSYNPEDTCWEFRSYKTDFEKEGEKFRAQIGFGTRGFMYGSTQRAGFVISSRNGPRSELVGSTVNVWRKDYHFIKNLFDRVERKFAEQNSGKTRKTLSERLSM